MRRRLATGAHLPHPRIVARAARRIEVTAVRPLPFEVDGEPGPAVGRVAAVVRPDAYRLLV
jgi:diacylglycerol kinase family enzyme